jgi:hypothetical protein
VEREPFWLELLWPNHKKVWGRVKKQEEKKRQMPSSAENCFGTRLLVKCGGASGERNLLVGGRLSAQGLIRGGWGLLTDE